MEAIRKRRRPRKRWTDELEEDLKIMGVRNWHTATGNWKEWRWILLEVEVNRETWCLRRRGRRGEEEEEGRGEGGGGQERRGEEKEDEV
jgi:hypothetical protein